LICLAILVNFPWAHQLRVRMGDWRARADLRESAQVTGELWLA
jgi:hypothetical protein